MKYTAFGEIREMNGSSPNDYESKHSFDFKANAFRIRSYTGQRKEVEFGLSYYNSRWVDCSTGHFISADTLIPQPGDSGNWDRYAYVLNNPLKYIDPSGHIPQIEGDDPITHWANQQANLKAIARGHQSANQTYIRKSKPQYSGLACTAEELMTYSMITRQVENRPDEWYVSEVIPNGGWETKDFTLINTNGFYLDYELSVKLKWTTDFSFTSSDVTAYRNKISLGGLTIKESGLETTIFKTRLSEKMNMALKWGNIGDPRKVSHAMQFSRDFPKLEGDGALKITQTLEVKNDRIAGGTGVAVVVGAAYLVWPALFGAPILVPALQGGTP